MNLKHEDTDNPLEAGARAFQRWSDQLRSDPEFAKVYEEEAAKSELWIQLVEARLQAGLTQSEMAERLGVPPAQIAQIEERGYDAYTLSTLRQYVLALGGGYELVVRIEPVNGRPEHPLRAAS